MLNGTTASRLLETTNSVFERIRSQHSDGELNSSSDLRDYRIKLIADKNKQQFGRATMEFKLQEQTQEIEELKLVNLQYQATIKTVTSKNREFKIENQHLIEQCKREARTEAPESKKALKRLLDENIDINANTIKRTPDRCESAKPADSSEKSADKKDDQIAKLRSHNATLLKEKEDLVKKGERFKAAYTEFKRSYEDLRVKYEEVREEKKADLIKDPRITKKISNDKDLKIQELSKLNTELQEQLQKHTERAASPSVSTVKKERGAEFDQKQPAVQPNSAATASEAEQKIKQHEAKIKKLEESQGILEDILRKKDSSLALKETEIQQLANELDKLRNRFSQFNVNQDGLQTERKADKVRISELEKECQSLKEQHEKELKNATERLEKEKQLATSNLTRELANQRTKAESLNEQLTKTKNEQETRITALKSELDKKQQKVGESSKANDELARMKSELAAKESEMEKYKVLYEKANDDIQRKQNQINELTRSNNDHQKNYSMIERCNSLLEEKLATSDQLLKSYNLMNTASGYASYSPSPVQQQPPASAFVPVGNPILIQPPLFNPASTTNSSRNSPLTLQPRAGLNPQNLSQQQQKNLQTPHNPMNPQPAYLAHHQQQRNGKSAQLAQALVLQQQQQQKSASPLSPSLNQQVPARMAMSGLHNMPTSNDQLQVHKAKFMVDKKEKSPSPSGRDSDKK